MAFYVFFENENTFLFLYFIWLLLNLQMCQIILPDPVYIFLRLRKETAELCSLKINRPNPFWRFSSFKVLLEFVCSRVRLKLFISFYMFAFTFI